MASLQPLTAEPPSPAEEDISRAGTYDDDDSSTINEDLTDKKGKGKQRAEGLLEDDDDSDGSVGEGGEGYPPLDDEEAESQRVEENLRRWEMAERQRRKAARESVTSVASSSLVVDVSRKASLLWQGRRAKQGGSGTHHALQTNDNDVPLDDLDNSALSVPNTPTPDAENPFTTPAASTTSLNEPFQSAVMTESSHPSTVQTSTEVREDPDYGEERRKSTHPPPKPLDLPKPRTPPPAESPHGNIPPGPIRPPTVAPVEQPIDAPESRWWTDWLCGCRERGERQAGRTNPFE